MATPPDPSRIHPGSAQLCFHGVGENHYEVRKWQFHGAHGVHSTVLVANSKWVKHPRFVEYVYIYIFFIHLYLIFHSMGSTIFVCSWIFSAFTSHLQSEMHKVPRMAGWIFAESDFDGDLMQGQTVAAFPVSNMPLK